MTIILFLLRVLRFEFFLMFLNRYPFELHKFISLYIYLFSRCVFGEMLKGHPILTGNSDVDQLKKIFQLCGSPNDRNYPSFRTLPGTKHTQFEECLPTLRDRFYGCSGRLIFSLSCLNFSFLLSSFYCIGSKHSYWFLSPLFNYFSLIYTKTNEYGKKKKIFSSLSDLIHWL